MRILPEYLWGGLVAAVAVTIAAASTAQYLAAAAVAGDAAVPSPAGLPTREAVVVRAVDGATLLVRLEDGRRRTVVLTGVAAPQCYAQEAAAALAAELPAGTVVRLETDPRMQGGAGGSLARYVWVRQGQDWVLVNKQQIVHGLVTTSWQMTALRYERELTAAQGLAAEQRRGRWAAC